MDEDLKFYYEQLEDRKEKIEKRLTRNVVLQFFSIVIGLSLIFNYSNLSTKFLDEYLHIDNNIVIIIAVTIFLVYLFIEFGYTLGAYFHVVGISDKILSKLIDKVTPQIKDVKHREFFTIPFRSINLFEPIAAAGISNEKSSVSKIQVLMASFVSIVLIALNHFTILKIIEDYAPEPIARYFKYILILILLLFYIQYIISNSKITYSPKKVTNVTALIAALISLYFVLDDFIPAIKFTYLTVVK